MPRPVRHALLALFALGLALVLQDASRAHGGTFRGPADAAPPSGPSAGGGAAPSAAGGAPASGGGAAQGPGGGSSPGGGPAPSAPAAGASGSGAPVGISAGSEWTQWWELNKDLYLDLKARLYGYDVAPGSAQFFLGGMAPTQFRDSLQPTAEQIQRDVVPALLAALETESHNEIITGCLIALAKTGRTESPAVAARLERAIVPFLDDHNQEIAETAALSLGILGHDAGRAVLIELLHDTEKARRQYVGSTSVNYRTRAFAAYGLSMIGSRTSSEAVRSEIVEALFGALDRDDSAAKDVRVACLVGLGRVPLATVSLPASAGPRSAWPPSSCRLAQFDAVLAWFRDAKNDFLVRAHAPATLVALLEGLTDNPRADLRETLANDFVRRIVRTGPDAREVVQGCVIALGLIGDADDDAIDREVRETLMEIDEHVADSLARNLAHIALAQIGARPGNGEWERGRHEIERAIGTRLHGGTRERPWAALAVGVLGHADIVAKRSQATWLGRTLLESLKKAKAPDEVGALAIAAGMIGLEDALPILRVKLAETSVDEARGYLVLAMGLIGRRDSVGLVQSIVRESQYRPTLLRQAAVSLGLMGDKRLVTELVGMLAEARGLATQAATASALGFIGDSRSIEPLIEMLGNDQRYTDTARGFAAVSLGLVADESALPWNATFASNINYRAVTPTLNDDAGAGLLNIL